MKQDVFNQYVERVLNLFNIESKDFFSKSRKRELVDARQLVYYLCSKRPITVNYIEKFMKERGYDIHRTSISHGVTIVSQKIAEDKDYKSIVQEIERAVHI
jgi:chromosomal replication initiation ATPase DnaA